MLPDQTFDVVPEVRGELAQYLPYPPPFPSKQGGEEVKHFSLRQCGRRFEF
jgi:hypothetical protein